MRYTTSRHADSSLRLAAADGRAVGIRWGSTSVFLFLFQRGHVTCYAGTVPPTTLSNIG